MTVAAPPRPERETRALGGWGQGARLAIMGAALLLVAALLRSLHLAADPPLRLDWSQAPFTDGARVVDGARNQVLFGRWVIDPLNPAVAHYPLSNALAWLVFRLAGVGIAQAAVSSVAAGVLSVFFIGLGLYRWAGPLPAALGGLFMAVNYHLIMFDRMPMSEALMIGLMSAAACALGAALQGDPPGRRPLLAAGALVGTAAFFVKLHALVLLPAGVLAIFGANARAGRGWRAARRDAALFAGVVGGLGVAWLLTSIATHPAAMGRFLQANVVGHYNYPVQDQGAVESFQIFLRKRVQGLFGFGVNVTFLWRSCLVAVAGLLLFVRYLNGLPRRWRATPPFENLLVLWLGTGMLAVSLLDYRPLRYHIMLLPPLCALAALALAEFLRGRGRWRLPPLNGRRWLLVPAAGFFAGYQFIGEGGRLLVFHSRGIYDFLTALRLDGDAIMNAVGKLTQGFWKPTFTAVAVCALVVAGYALVERAQRRGGGWALAPRRREAAVLAFLAISLAWDLGQYMSWAARPRWTLLEAGRDLGQIVGPGAVIMGVSATTICLENRHVTVPNDGDLVRRNQPDVLGRYPITHFLYRGGRLRPYLEKHFPQALASQVFVRSYAIAGENAELWRVPAWPGSRGRDYRPTAFEEGIAMLQQSRFAEGARAFEAFLRDHPDNGNACVVLAACYSELGRGEETLGLFERAAKLRPRDAAVQEDLGDLYLQRGDAERARAQWKRAVELDPGNEDLRGRLRQLESRGREGFDFTRPARRAPAEQPVRPPMFEGDDR